jgi:GSH-dependent disulfide-bond oxidoreductase
VLNPNGKIPAIYGPDGPSGTPLALFESGAILLYVADEMGQIYLDRSEHPLRNYPVGDVEMGGVGPMFGQVGFFNKSAGKLMRTSAHATATQSNQRGCSVSSTNGSRAATG